MFPIYIIGAPRVDRLFRRDMRARARAGRIFVLPAARRLNGKREDGFMADWVYCSSPGRLTFMIGRFFALFSPRPRSRGSDVTALFSKQIACVGDREIARVKLEESVRAASDFAGRVVLNFLDFSKVETVA